MRIAGYLDVNDELICTTLYLDNSDLLAVSVTDRLDGSKQQRRFLVVDIFHIVLVEPDSSRLGWGVATFVGFLQACQI